MLFGCLSLRYAGGGGRTLACGSSFQSLFKLNIQLGVPLATVKVTNPSVVLTFLDTELDTALGLFKFPVGKLDELQNNDSRFFIGKKSNAGLSGVAGPSEIYL